MTAAAAINSAGANMLSALIKQLEQLQKPWQQTPEREQEKVIFHLRESVEAAARQLVKAIAGGNHPSIPASVESVTFKDGVKVSLKLAKGTESLHALVDAQGSVVQIVLASVDQYIDGIQQIRASADQAELFERHDGDETTEASATTPAEFVNSLNETASPDSGVPQTLFGLLASVGCHVPLETVRTWTKEQFIVAADWVGEYSKTPPGEMCAIARPHWLPMPELTETAGESIELSSDLYDRAGLGDDEDEDDGTELSDPDEDDLDADDVEDEEIEDEEEIEDDEHEDAA